MEQWLIRTTKNKIEGPVSKEKLCQLISSGQLDLEDEICPANGYWFFVHEQKEVFRYLNIKVPLGASRARPMDDDVTDTQIPVETDPSISTQGLPSQSGSTRTPTSRLSPISSEVFKVRFFWFLLPLVILIVLTLWRYFHSS